MRSKGKRWYWGPILQKPVYRNYNRCRSRTKCVTSPVSEKNVGGWLTSHAAHSSNNNVLDVRRCELNPKTSVKLEHTLSRTSRTLLGVPVAAILLSHPLCLVMDYPKRVPPASCMCVTLPLRRKSWRTLAGSDKSRCIGKPSETCAIALRDPTFRVSTDPRESSAQG